MSSPGLTIPRSWGVIHHLMNTILQLLAQLANLHWALDQELLRASILEQENAVLYTVLRGQDKVYLAGGGHINPEALEQAWISVERFKLHLAWLGGGHKEVLLYVLRFEQHTDGFTAHYATRTSGRSHCIDVRYRNNCAIGLSIRLDVT
ncbi:MAG TPA: hypothetical protein VLI05_07085 [Candidatus Saccharimonadia bacterium]|nr:hypothetical protein [Candidatus Saccharimonadia bacterium]